MLQRASFIAVLIASVLYSVNAGANGMPAANQVVVERFDTT